MIEATDEIDEYGQRWLVMVYFGERIRVMPVDRPLEEEPPAAGGVTTEGLEE